MRQGGCATPLIGNAYYIDPGYHLGNIYVSLLDQAESGRMTPQIQAYLGIFTGTYEAGMEEVLLCFAVSALALGVARVAMERKEVY